MLYHSAMKLSEYLSQHKISQQEAAIGIGVSAGRVGHFCREEDYPPPKVCVRIERWTGNKVTRPELRPHDYLEYWPELVCA